MLKVSSVWTDRTTPFRTEGVSKELAGIVGHSVIEDEVEAVELSERADVVEGLAAESGFTGSGDGFDAVADCLCIDGTIDVRQFTKAFTATAKASTRAVTSAKAPSTKSAKPS